MKFDEFKSLMKQASEDTWHLSSPNKANAHQNIQKIIATINPDCVGYALLLLGDEEYSFFQLLHIVSHFIPEKEHPPIPDYYAGRVSVIIECYHYWALKEKYVFSKYDVNSYWVEDKYGNKGNWS